VKYRVRHSRQARKALAAMAREDADRILAALRKLADTGEGDIKALQGEFKGSFSPSRWKVARLLPSSDAAGHGSVQHR